MRILLVIGGFSFGGAERVMCSLANYFVSIGHEVTLIAISRKEKCYQIDEKVKVVNGIEGSNKITLILNLRKTIKNLKPNVILSFLTQINIAVIIAALGTRVPVVVSERNSPKYSPKERHRKLLRFIFYNFAQGLVFQTDEAKNYFNKRIKVKSIVIPNPIFLSTEVLDINLRKNEIVSVGRLVKQKNHDQIIRAFAKISSKHPKYTLHIYGEGDQRESLIKLINYLNMNEQVFLHGETKRLHDKIKSAKIFIMASEYEGMPNALMESMALGLACISTDCPSGGPAFLIENMKNGILIPVNDEEILRKSIDHLLLNDQMRIKLSKEARKVYTEVDPNAIYEKWAQFLYFKSSK